jgi:hypothetical protein
VLYFGFIRWDVSGELISFSGSVGYGRPLTTTLGTVLLNNGNPNVGQ